MPLKPEQGQAAILFGEQLQLAHESLRATINIVGDGSPWPREAIAKRCAYLTASINIMVRLGMIDFELHDAIAEVALVELANSKGININTPPKEGK